VSYRLALVDPVARRLLAAQAASDLGDFAGTAALILMTYHETGNVIGPAFVVASGSLPTLLVGTLLGGWLDRPARRPALIALSLVGAVAAGAVAAWPSFGTAVAASFVLGAARTAYVGIKVGAVAEAVPAAAQTSFFTVTTTIGDLAQIVGLLAGASVTLAIGARASLGFDAVTFLVGAAFLVGLPRLVPKRPDRRPTSGAGWKAIRTIPALWILTPVVCAGICGSALPETLAPKLASGTALPFVMAAFPVGSVLATVLVIRTTWLERVTGQIGVALTEGLAFGLGATVLALRLGPWSIAAANCVIGAATVWIIGTRTTFVRSSPPHLMAQVEATILAMVTVAQGLGTLALSGVSTASSPAASYGTAAALVILVASWALGRSRTLTKANLASRQTAS
jgi:MFS family permease